MKIFIFGSNGMLGNYFKKYLSQHFEVVPLTRKDFDLGKSTEREIKDFIHDSLQVRENDVILNASGIIKQRNFDIKELIAVNSMFPNILSDVKSTIGCKVIHITTDCVFSGNKGKYAETDLHDCLDEYGKSKSLGENKNLTVIRTSIIGEERHNKKSLIAWTMSNKGNEVNGFKNHLWNGVTCLELSKLIQKIINENLFWEGVQHVHSPNTISKCDLLKVLNKVYNLELKIKEVTVEKCDRSLSSSYPQLVTNSIETQVDEQSKFQI